MGSINLHGARLTGGHVNLTLFYQGPEAAQDQNKLKEVKTAGGIGDLTPT